jgi:deoxyribonuclease V
MHSWDVTPKEAIGIQKELQDKVSNTPLKRPIRTIAGADVSLNMFSSTIYAGIIVLSYPDLVPIAHAVVQSETKFPYIPGLLSFREIPALMKCLEDLKKRGITPDAIMVDGQGIAHPRRLGIAAHFGVLSGIPTLGCAKSILYGKYDVPENVGDESPLTDPKTGEIIGTALKSKTRSNPLIISPGHLMSVEDSRKIAKACLKGYKLPEPTRLAHELVNKFRTGELGGTLL